MHHRNIFIAGVLFWTIVMVGLTWLDIRESFDSIKQTALEVIRENYQKDLLYRRWAASLGGVYVPVTKNTPPNPNLLNYPERDITTPSRRVLTFLNHEYMIRLINEMDIKSYGMKEHLTSANPVNMQNTADNWEKKALLSIEKGNKEYFSFDTIENKEYIRYMGILINEENCLKCHATQGYKVGDIRGGICISFPWKPYHQIYEKEMKGNIIRYVLLWIIGIIALCFAMYLISDNLKKRIKVEEALYVSEGRYRKAQEVGHVGSWEYDIKSDTFWGSDEGKKIYGFNLKIDIFSEKEVMNCVLERDRVNQAMINLIEKNEPYNIEFEIIQLNSSVKKAINSIAELVYDENGIPIKVTGVMHDITERKQAEQTLQKLNLAINNSKEVVLMTDKEGIITYINPEFTKMYGFTAEEVVGKVTPRILNSGLYSKEQAEKLWNTLINKQSVPATQFQNKCKDGKLIDVEGSADPILDDNGEIIGFIGVQRDITERKQAEEALKESEQLLRESQTIARLGSFAWDISTGLWKSSEILDELFGIDENYARTLEGWSSIVHPDWQKIMTEYVMNEVIGKLQKFDKEYQIIRQKDGQERWVHGLAVLELDSNNQPIRLIGTISDITERKQAEGKLHESEEKYRIIFENAQEGIFQTNINGTYISVNPAFAKMFGFDSPEELINTRHDISKDSYFDPIERDKFLSMIEKQGFVKGYEYEVKHKDGTKIWFYEDSIAIKDESGRIQYFEGFVVDITERKRVEELYKLNFENQKVINSLLQLSHSNFSIEEILENALDIIFKIPWLGIQTEGAIFLVEPGTSILRMKANRNLSKEIQLSCARVPFGKCLCGKAILSEKLIFTNNLDDSHSIHYEGMKNHGHYCLPIRSDEERLGVLNLYLSPGHQRNEEEENILISIANVIAGIIKRKTAEESLSEKEVQYRTLADTGMALIWTAGTDKLCNYFNEPWLKFTGRTLEQEIGNGWTEGVHPDDFELCLNIYINAFDKREKFIMEYRLRHVSGEYRWITDLGTPSYNSNKEFIGYIGHCFDITERKRAEEELKKLNKAVENSSEVIFMTDKNGLFNFVNPAFTEVYGYKADEVVSKTTPRILKSGMNKTSDYEAFWQTLLNKQVIKGDLINKTKDGKLLNIEGSTSPVFDESGDITGFLAIQRDITERKLAEGKQQLQITALNAAANAIVITNNEGTIEWVNSAFTTLTGYDFAEAIGKNPREILKSGMHDNSFYQDLWDTILAGEIWRGETINRRKNGTLYNEMQTITPLKETDGKINHFISIKEDNTDRKHAEQELIIAKELAEESDNLKTAFLQNMSHEIRTPLSGIIGFSRLLNSENLSKEDIQEFTNIITVSSERLIEIVNNVLEMSKIQTGLVKVVLEPILINMLFSDLFVFFSHIAEAKNIGLNYHNTDDTDRTIYSDEGKLNQILSYLINNSIKFTNSGQIDYGYEIIDTYIQFYVKDTGVGIPEELHEKIFDRFTQAEQSISRNYEGAGLGLAICKGLVELLGGRIRVESEINKGTAFYFTLPYKEEILQTQEDKENPEYSVKIAKCKILLAEDDWISSQYLIRFFEDANITVIHAGNGEKAVELVRNTPDIDLIVMDIKMPVMDGFEAAKLIKNIRPDLPIIAQTAYAFVEEKQKILSAGFDDYISKPYDSKKLMALIGKYLKIN